MESWRTRFLFIKFYPKKIWEVASCVRFRRMAVDEDGVIFTTRYCGCCSEVGHKTDSNIQAISVGPGCDEVGTIAHEIGHALGFYHEMSRPDRNTAVTILWENIHPENIHPDHVPPGNFLPGNIILNTFIQKPVQQSVVREASIEKACIRNMHPEKIIPENIHIGYVHPANTYPGNIVRNTFIHPTHGPSRLVFLPPPSSFHTLPSLLRLGLGLLLSDPGG